MIQMKCLFFTSVVSWLLLLLLLSLDNNVVNGIDPWAPVYTRPIDTTTKCSICDHLELELNDGVIVENTNLTCGQLEQIYKDDPSERVSCSRYFPSLVQQCCNFTGVEMMNTYDCEANVRNEILADDNIKTVSPFAGFYEPIIIEARLQHEMLHEIDIKQSTASVFVTMELKWHDPRLKWNISRQKCATGLRLRASESPEETEIWVPDFDLVNRKHGTYNFDLTKAIVTHEGIVTWIRSGHLTAFCSFSGLERIPFDTLGCQLSFSNRLLADKKFKFVSPTQDTAFSVGTFQQKYKEFSLLPNKTNVTFFEDKSGFHFNLFYQRSSEFYVLKIILPTCYFTFISFGLFIMHMDSGERLGFGLSVVLVIIAQEIITNEYIPQGEERLWINMFIQGSTYFTLIALFETIMMNWLYYFYLRKQHDEKIPFRHKEETNTPSTSTTNNPKESQPMGEKSLSFHSDNDKTGKDEEIASFSCDEAKDFSKEDLHIGTNTITNNDTKKEDNRLAIERIRNNDNDTKPIKETRFQKEQCIIHSSSSTRALSDETWSLMQKITPSILKNIESEEDARSLVKKIDNACLVIFPLSYVIFIIVMFQYNKSMDVENDSWY